MITSTLQRVGEDLTLGVSPVLKPHPSAPMFPDNSYETMNVFRQTITLITSGNFPQTEEVRSLFSQAGLVSLWFFLKFIAGYSGPYDDLDTSLHLDMCNFYQLTSEPGTWSAMFLPRFHLKSTIGTHGSNTWELVRNPDLSIVMASSIIDRALEFMHVTQRTFDQNEFFAWLYPQKVPRANQPRWNDSEMTVPDRTRNRPEPSIKPIAAGGSTQGVHGLLMKIDDIIGDKDLDSQRMSAASMLQRKNWLRSNINTILSDWVRGRVFVAGTRYATDDAYDFMFDSIKHKYGYWSELPYRTAEKGKWHIYYRMGEENGHIIMPQRVSREELDRLKEEDWWTYVTQIANNPFGIESNELSDYVGDIGKAEIYYSQADDDFVLHLYNPVVNFQEDWLLSQCDVLTGCDPAGTERNIATARSSRSVAIVYARTPHDDRVIVRLDAEFVDTPTMLNWLFRNRLSYRALSRTVLETQGAFKILEGIIRDEERRRREYLNLRPVSAINDKVVRIRNELKPVFSRKQLYVPDEYLITLKEELMSFPLSKRMDVLDALAICEKASFKPPSADDADIDDEDEQRIDEYELSRNPVTGY